MLMIISPAKTLDFETKPHIEDYTLPEYTDEAKELVKHLRKYSKSELVELMKINDQLAELNYKRFKKWKLPFTPDNAKQAALAYRGDVYTSLATEYFTQKDFEFAQKHLRIISGLYGLLRPLDLIQPYRLEMDTSLEINDAESLYKFWSSKVTPQLSRDTEESGTKVLLNLASQQYGRIISKKRFDYEIVTPVFKEDRNGKLRTYSVYAKQARGIMCRYVIKNQINDVEELKSFDIESYRYNEELSTKKEWLFVR